MCEQFPCVAAPRLSAFPPEALDEIRGHLNVHINATSKTKKEKMHLTWIGPLEVIDVDRPWVYKVRNVASGPDEGPCKSFALLRRQNVGRILCTSRAVSC